MHGLFGTAGITIVTDGPGPQVHTLLTLHEKTYLFSLFRMLPKARVVYCSATGVSDVKNMVCISPQRNL